MSSPTLSVSGAIISYISTSTTASASKPLLLLIPGANGEPSIFGPITPFLDTHYTVATLTRRGFSGSQYTTPNPDFSTPTRLHADADDAAALIAHLSPDAPAYVLGWSSGAIVALTLLSRHPDKVAYLVAHEPPLTKLLGAEGQAKWAQYQAIEQVYRAKGVHAAVEGFVPEIAIPGSPEEVMAMGMAAPQADENARFFFENELLAYTAAELDLEKLKEVGRQGKWAPAYGEETTELFFRNVVKNLAAETGVAPAVVPGGHFGHVAKAEDFATKLRSLLNHGKDKL